MEDKNLYEFCSFIHMKPQITEERGGGGMKWGLDEEIKG